ncbi:hypothetical protein BGW38_000327 [Lunasporangiospora selenospora]|uniref:Elongation factor Ts, mitochondrial n=1 Tax=Lunasporangiospora selenospora TaxID=979761 RepID=A0A9P6KEX2_9FUNG|nr:hypothetical protein BGW38_000327 [Lunasporangiospora selenospora]
MLRLSILARSSALSTNTFVRNSTQRIIVANAANSFNVRRHSSTTAPAVKPNIKLIAEIRKAMEGVSMLKAKEALIQTNNDLEKALEWVREDEQKAGIKKAEKLKDRQALEGLVGVVVGELGTSGNRGAIVEINCETDFVSRNDLFKSLVSQIASTALLVVDGPAKQSAETEGLVHDESITRTIAKLGENISLRRCAIVNIPENQRGLVLTGGATHGGDKHPNVGKVGALSVLTLVPKKSGTKVVPSTGVTTLSRQLTRHVIASPSVSIHQEDCKIPLEISNGGHAPPEEVDAWLDERVLMRQPFVFGGGKVEQVIAKIAKEDALRIKVMNALRWERGEGMVKAESPDFAEEVRRQIENK